MWLDGSDQGSGSIEPSSPSNGTTITKWKDKTGNGRYISQNRGFLYYNSSHKINNKTTVSNKFVYNQPWTTYAYLGDSNHLSDNEYSYFMVFKKVGSTYSNHWQNYFRQGGYSSGFKISFLVSSDKLEIRHNNSTQINSSSWSLNSAQLVSIVFKDGTITAYRNGSSKASKESAPDLTSTSGGGAYFGASTPEYGNYSMDLLLSVGEVITYNAGLSNSNRSALENALKSKWGL
jgi:hypothetical protein